MIRKKPNKVLVNGKEHKFVYLRGMLYVHIPVKENSKHVNIDILL